LEVAQIGRFIAQKVLEKAKVLSNSSEHYVPFVNAVEVACLIHDIGNPPFGHFGETAIKNWATEKSNKIKKTSHEWTSDLVEFDGNPQGFRLVSFLNGFDEHGSNLTATVLLSTIKYPWSGVTRPHEKLGKKIGFYEFDRPTYEEACSRVDWEAGKVFPLAKLMEAADDIAYSTSDLEDGLEKGLYHLADLANAVDFETKDVKDNTFEAFVNFKSRLVHGATEEAADNFIKLIEKILNGDEVKIVTRHEKFGSKIDLAKQFTKKHIYTDDSVEHIELAGLNIISGLLALLDPLMELDEQAFLALIDLDSDVIKRRDLFLHRRLSGRLPKRYIDKYRNSKISHEMTRRGHLIVDYISGMSDGYAQELYRKLSGY